MQADFLKVLVHTSVGDLVAERSPLPSFLCLALSVSFEDSGRAQVSPPFPSNLIWV